MKLILKSGLLAAMMFALVGSTAQAAVNPGPYAANACLAAKTKCVIKMKSCLLGCYGKGAGKGVAADAACLDKCRNGFLGDPAIGKGCMEKADAKFPGGCGGNQTDAARALTKAKIQAHAEDLYRALSPGGVNPVNKCAAGKLKCVTKFNACVLGILAKAYKAGGALGDLSKCNAILQTGAKASCFDKLEAKGGCNTVLDQGVLKVADELFINEVIADFNAPAGIVNSKRCVSDTATECSTDGDCGGGPGDCQFFFGAPLPLVAGGVASCVLSQWNGGITGTFNRETGESVAATAKLISRVYTLGDSTEDEPCPRCVGDATANDNVKGGTCSFGLHDGDPCDANGLSPVPSFGSTSLDCPPDPGTNVGNLPVSLSNSSNVGTQVRNISAASPNCNLIGWAGKKCLCSTCNLNPTVGCFGDADCPLGDTCRVTGSFPNAKDRAPNACDDQICTTVAGGEGVCAAGPFDQTCLIENFRSCDGSDNNGTLGAGDCPAEGDVCAGTNRACFAGYNGVVGTDTGIKAVGSATVPHNQTSTSIFGSVFCVAHTDSSAINEAAGLPGPGRLELGGVATENGTDATCPTQVSLTPSSKTGVLDTGWTGLGHNAKVVGQGTVTVSVTGCANATPPCGVCNYTGPIANP